MAEIKIAASDKKPDLLGLLKNKKPRTRSISVVVGDQEVTMTFKAISSHDLDELQAKHKPTTEQRSRGFAFNPNTFAPALVSACSLDPEITPEDAREIWDSPAWSTGELNQLFDTCSSLCMEGMQIPFTKSD